MLARLCTLATMFVVLAVMLPGDALAHPRARVVTDLNMREGPSTRYGVIRVIPGGTVVPINHCTRSYSWCEISYRGSTGWVYARYLQARADRYQGRPVPEVGAQLGLALVEAILGELQRRDRDRDDDDDDDDDRDRRGPRPGQICFYEHFDFEGERFCIQAGQSNPSLSQEWNDRISSIRVGPGAQVQVCEHFNFEGSCRAHSQSVERLTGSPNDTISSYRSRRGRGGFDDRQESRVCFFEHYDFEGDSFCANPGDTNPSLGEAWNDRISSIRVGSGLTVQVCQHFDFGGWCEQFSSNVSQLTGERNDQISSYRAR